MAKPSLGEYAAVTKRVIDFCGVPDDLTAGVAVSMERQQIITNVLDRS